ncbi:MAG: type II toxin-antitoxin system Phd/YefM family antitoxin [bacterium]|nr:type II toxin-antitoxin system Phd/YefM family antitoxin [bacterium]
MKNINISQDIIPIGEFKTHISKCFKNIQNTGHPLIITQNGKPAGVLLSPGEYDELVYKYEFISSIERGLADSDAGNVYSTDELKDELRKRRKERDSK